MTEIDEIRVPSLPVEYHDILTGLLKQLKAKRERNRLRDAYYDGKHAVRDLGISTPPQMRRLATVLGWPAKSVDMLNRRCNLDGFVIPGSTADSLGIGEIWDANRLDIEQPQAGVSSLTHSVAWLVVTRGDTMSGEPEVLVSAKDANSGTGMWDARRRGVKSFLSIHEVDDKLDPTAMTLYLPGRNVLLAKNGTWSSEIRKTPGARVPVEPLVYRSRLGRPFGSSRISRPVMSITDMALRTVIRSEVSAEFYSSPQRYLLGASESAFEDEAGNPRGQWRSLLGRIWAIEDDPESDPQTARATVGQFPQMSQQPHMDQLRSLAQLFSGETSITITSLGISSDANPASAEAYEAASRDLTAEAEGTVDEWGPAWCRTMISAMQMRDGLSEPRPEWSKLRAKWRNPRYESRAAAADATVKMVGAFPWMAESDTAVELLGFDQTTTERLLADKRRANASKMLNALTAPTPPPQQSPADQGQPQAQEQPQTAQQPPGAVDGRPVR